MGVMPAQVVPTIFRMPEMIQINFNRMFPVFPLAGVCLLPHASIPIHVFEQRYVKMVNDVLDEYGQIAMATFLGNRWKKEYHGNPPIRPIVCLSQIERHEKLHLNRYNVYLHGICRAKIVEEVLPTEDCPYRKAKLVAVESDPSEQEAALTGWRSRIRDLLDREAFRKLRLRSHVIQWFDRDDIPSHVLVEIIGQLLITTTDDINRRYKFLSEPEALERAEYAEEQLELLEYLILRASAQTEEWPKGLSWN